MISTKRAGTILFECNPDKRNKMIDELSESDVKYLLKVSIAVMKGETADVKLLDHTRDK